MPVPAPPQQYLLDFRLVVTLALSTAAVIVAAIVIYLKVISNRHED